MAYVAATAGGRACGIGTTFLQPVKQVLCARGAPSLLAQMFGRQNRVFMWCGVPRQGEGQQTQQPRPVRDAPSREAKIRVRVYSPEAWRRAPEACMY
jgi:hypothetical protein